MQEVFLIFLSVIFIGLVVLRTVTRFKKPKKTEPVEPVISAALTASFESNFYPTSQSQNIDSYIKTISDKFQPLETITNIPPVNLDNINYVVPQSVKKIKSKKKYYKSSPIKSKKKSKKQVSKPKKKK